MAHAKVEIYTTTYCSYCKRAKMLLDSKGIDFIEHPVDGDEKAREELVKISGGSKTVPQIFINDQHVGGCDDLYALDRSGELDELLKEA